jgi:hypothetical protein
LDFFSPALAKKEKKKKRVLATQEAPKVFLLFSPLPFFFPLPILTREGILFFKQPHIAQKKKKKIDQNAQGNTASRGIGEKRAGRIQSGNLGEKPRRKPNHCADLAPRSQQISGISSIALGQIRLSQSSVY